MIGKSVGKHLTPLAFFGIDMNHFQNMAKFHNTFLNFLTISGSEVHFSNLVLKAHHTWNYPMLQMYPLLIDILSFFFGNSGVEMPEVCHYSFVLHHLSTNQHYWSQVCQEDFFQYT